MPEPNGDGGTNNTVIAEQLQLLGFIQVLKFVASPMSVEPFQSTTVSYQVKLPTNLKVPVTFSINGKSLGNGLENSASFTLSSNTTFGLHAATALTGKNIASIQVTVDQSQCHKGSIDGFPISAVLKSNLDQSFAGKTSGNGTTVALGLGTISIAIPLGLDSQGTMNFDIELGVVQNGQGIYVTDNRVTVQVHLNTDLNVDSWCSNAIQEIVQPFMQHIVDAEIVPAVSQQLMGQINASIASAEHSDPMHRAFALTAFALTNDGASFTVCPTTPGLLGGGSHTNR